MKDNIFKRVVAYFIDVIIVMILVTVITDSKINPMYDSYIENGTKYVNYNNSYYKMNYFLPSYYSDNNLSEEEYQKLITDNDIFSYLLVEKYDDKELTKEEYDYILNVVKEDYDKNYKDIYYNYEKSNLFYYIIYVILFLAYFVGFNVITNGVTLGKKICKLKITGSNDEKVHWYNYLIRSLILYNLIFYIIRIGFILLNNRDIFLTWMNGISYIEIIVSYIVIFSILFSKSKIGIHDKLANTKVINL